MINNQKITSVLRFFFAGAGLVILELNSTYKS
jgi:hypothetical protein